MIKKPKNLTSKSGVYLFKNAKKQIVYIGKAKNIAVRITSYFSKPIEYKASLFLDEAKTIETIPTNSELEALYLEAELIKKYQPKYNQLLKDGNPFVYLFFSDEQMPTLSIVRTKSKKGTCIGPFLSKKIAHSLYNFLTQTFHLKLCKRKVRHGCLQYHIGICAGYCLSNFDKDFYIFRLTLAKHVLQQNQQETLEFLNNEIKNSAQNLQFEHAQQLFRYKQDFEHIINTLNTLADMPSKQQHSDTQQNLDVLMKVQKRLFLKHIPYVIDCFDISHMQGQAMVGSCIRYVHGIPETKLFRRFQIKSLQNQDDYKALAEIVRRRYQTKATLPNLIIVDGGKGQISAIKPFIGTTELVGLAKKEETIISSNLQHFIQLDQQKAEDRLLLQIRDKAHSFALAYHRKKHTLFTYKQP